MTLELIAIIASIITIALTWGTLAAYLWNIIE